MSLEMPQNQMEENEPNLKAKFLSGKITPTQFRDSLLELDQSTANKEHSLKNLETLKDPEIFNWFTEHSEYLPEYNSFLSFTEFHVAQLKALENSSEEAKVHFQNALEASEQGRGNDEDWKNYIHATNAYLNNDLESLKKFSDQIVDGKNKTKTKQFIKGLEERGEPHYSEDYLSSGI